MAPSDMSVTTGPSATSQDSTAPEAGGSRVEHGQGASPMPAIPALPQDPSVPLPGFNPFARLPVDMVLAIAELADAGTRSALRGVSKSFFQALRMPVAGGEQARAERLLEHLPPNGRDETGTSWDLLEGGLRRLVPEPDRSGPPPEWVTRAFARWAARVAQFVTVDLQPVDATVSRLRNYLRPDLAAELLLEIAGDTTSSSATACAILHDIHARVRGHAPPVEGQVLADGGLPVGPRFGSQLEKFVADMQTRPAKDRLLALALLCSLVPAAAHPQASGQPQGLLERAQSAAPALFGDPPGRTMNVVVHRLMKHICDSVERLPAELKPQVCRHVQRTLEHLSRYQGACEAWTTRVREVLQPGHLLA